MSQEKTETHRSRPSASHTVCQVYFTGRFSACPRARRNKDLCPRLTNVHVNWPFRCHLQQQLGSQLSSGFCRGLISPWMGESLNINRTRHREARAMEDSTRRQGQSAGTPWLSPSLPATHWVQNRGMPGKGFRLPSPTHPIHTPHFPNAQKGQLEWRGDLRTSGHVFTHKDFRFYVCRILQTNVNTRGRAGGSQARQAARGLGVWQPVF